MRILDGVNKHEPLALSLCAEKEFMTALARLVEVENALGMCESRKVNYGIFRFHSTGSGATNSLSNVARFEVAESWSVFNV